MTLPESEAREQELRQMLLAFRSLSKTVEKQVMTGMVEGTSGIMSRSYRALHQRIAALLPDDFYITSVLVLEEFPEDEDEQVRVAQINMLCSQLVDYLNEMLKPRATAMGGEGDDWRGVGRDLQDQIMQMTRKTIRRALQNIDFELPPVPPMPPAPGMPPVPPMPPSGPKRKRIHIEFGTDVNAGDWDLENEEADTSADDEPKDV